MPRPRLRSGVARETWLAVCLWSALVGGCYLWARWLVREGYRVFVGNAAPLTGHVDARFSPRALVSVVVALVAVALAPRLAGRLGWRTLLLVAFGAAAVFAVALGFADGAGGLTRSLRSSVDYLRDVPKVGSPGAFLRGYVEEIDLYAGHVRTHPPGLILALWALDRLGLAGAGWAAALEIAGGAAAVPAVIVAIRDVAGEERARVAAPFLAFAPAALFVATSGDALFAGAGAWAVTLLVLSTGREGRRSDALALAGGALFGLALFLSYGLVLLAIVPLAAAIARGRARPLALASLGIAAVFLAFLAAGFWWIDGLLATRREYLESIVRFRPGWYFVVANLAAFALALGPAAAAALARLRDPRVWVLAGAGLAAVLLADLSGMSKGEVERIWLPFAVWVLAATAAFEGSNARAWLALQVGSALALQLLVVSSW